MLEIEYRQPTVLIVDDEPLSLDMLRLALRDEYKILTANNGREGLNIATAQLPDIILLDIVMPEMDGYEVCLTIKDNPDLCDIPVLFISCMSEPENEFQGLEYGAVDYITKPYNREIARLRVKTHLQIKKQRDMLAKQATELQKANAELEKEITCRKLIQADQEHLIAELKAASAKVTTLTGLLPICASCKKVRDDKGYWAELDSFLGANSKLEFSHGLCKDCATKLYPDFSKPE